VKRREFIAFAGGAVAASWPLTARAQQLVTPRIAVLLIAGPELMGPYREALRDLGYAEGKNIRIEVRSAEGQANRLPELASDIVRGKVDIIVASQAPAIAAAKSATSDIPIVMAPGGDPIALGFIASLARPGGNITGVATLTSELAAKSLELIPEFLPAARRLGFLGNANDPFVKPLLEQIQKSAPALRLEVRPILVRSGDDLEGAFATMAGERADAVVVQPSLPVKLTADLALKYRLPSLCAAITAVPAGHLLAYTASDAERGRQIAGYVDQLLKGAKPADLPVQQPTKFQIAINLATAKALGLEIAPTLLARADEVIE
jgi:putative ABC transport system substrate-binding protein